MLLKPNFRTHTLFPMFNPKILYLSLRNKPSISRSRLKPSISLSLFSTLNSHFSYGPSLHKGHKTLTLTDDKREEKDDSILDENSFTRIFYLSALRVPSVQCFALENRLRGHLLNWPRIKNIARVPGDEIDDDLKNLVPVNGNGDEEERLVVLNRRIYGKDETDGEKLSPVLYRDELVKTFNYRGYVKFRNLEKLTRPKKRKKKEGERRRIGRSRNEFAVVEIVEDEENEENDLKGLLGDEFKGRKWRGSTRLLLLDEQLADKGLDELPESVKAVFRENARQSPTRDIELLRCKLTLFYDYWQMDEILEALLPNGVTIPSAFETVGHIAHLNLRYEHLPHKNVIAKVVLDKNKPKIQTVVNKVDPINNEYRTMQLEILAGNHSLVTMVVENGLRFQVDLATVYWSSKLATERLRLCNSFTRDDVVCMSIWLHTPFYNCLAVAVGFSVFYVTWFHPLTLCLLLYRSFIVHSSIFTGDVFSGVGPIAISAAKKVKHVYANDLNPYAVEYLEKNCVLNKLERKIEVFNMDGRRFIDAIFSSQKVKFITQIVMNLPKDAAEFLDVFRGIFSNRTRDEDITFPKIHVYGFSKAEDPEYEFDKHIRIALSEVAVDIEMHRVRLVAPGKWMLCASFVLPKSVAFAKPLEDV
ncbi:SAM-dependent methyltransferase TRM5/TYW2-type [Dillenia turbinata]|uniref:tRNA (guanine(37)-N1)-methyltransferase n=1 Tax=Dillenia turbinata TaxID=194707 RepID=A0AAN8VIP0_9MAGN